MATYREGPGGILVPPRSLDELRNRFGGVEPRLVPGEILKEMLEVPYQPGNMEQSIRPAIYRAKSGACWREGASIPRPSPAPE